MLSSLLDRLLVDFAEQLQVGTLPATHMSRLGCVILCLKGVLCH